MVLNVTISPKEKLEVQAVEQHVGQRLKFRRNQLSLSQQEIAHAIGISYQQVQKYEKGVNRITAGRIYSLSRILDVDVGYFFEGLSRQGNDAPARANILDFSDLAGLNMPLRHALLDLLAALTQDTGNQ